MLLLQQKVPESRLALAQEDVCGQEGQIRWTQQQWLHRLLELPPAGSAQSKLSFQGPFSLDRFEELIAIPNGVLHQTVAETHKQIIPMRMAGLMPKDESYPTAFTWSLASSGMVEYMFAVVDTSNIPAPNLQTAVFQQLHHMCTARKTVIAGYQMEIRMRDPK